LTYFSYSIGYLSVITEFFQRYRPMTALRLLAIGMAASLAYSTSPAGPVVLGVVVVANRVHINTAAVTTGATVYDGDRFSTETRGNLLLRGNGAILQLAGESEVIVRSRTNGVQGIEAELNRGTLAFRSWQLAALEIVADEAQIRPGGWRGKSRQFKRTSRLRAARSTAVFAQRRNGDNHGRKSLSGDSGSPRE
jgi:hypothetical protein